MYDLKQHFLDRLGTHIDALHSAQKAFLSGSDDAVESIRRIAHSLKGSGGTYGFPSVTELAQSVEEAPAEELESALRALLDHLISLRTSSRGDKSVILIVEDSPEDQAILQAIFPESDYRVYVAGTAAEAQEILTRHSIHIILLDLILPDSDGRNLLVKFRESPQTVHTPVIILSAKDSPQTKTECFALGANEYFVKPVDAEVLATAVRAKLDQAQKIKSELRIDALTELPNRAALQEEFLRYKAQSQRHETPLSLAMLDLDHFKQVNDTYGHLIGDQVLQYFSRHLVRSLRKSDFVARWGGEEFVALLHNSTPEGGQGALEKLARRLKEKPFQSTGDAAVTIPITFSAGITEVTATKSINDAISDADELLYLGKHSGRDQILTRKSDIKERPRSILVAEDDELTADFILHRLKKSGYEITHYANGAEALKSAQSNTFDLIILDVKMPGMDGFEVLRNLRKDSRNNSVPIIMLTSMGRENDIVKGLDWGANDYMLKPFSATELLARIHRLLK
ncbi:MAG: response regulator [Candidatus Neomarinimicrobiota bacterium]|nr:MAG: response regulator [Candidatus Neomarinimicrobiota bacterium]